MNPKTHAKFVDDLDFFHSERKDGFNKYIKTITSLKNFWKTHISGLVIINLIIFAFSFIFQNKTGLSDEPNFALIIAYLLGNTSFVFMSFVRYLVLISKQIFFKNSLQNRFAGHKMADIQHDLRKIAEENDSLNDFENFIYNIQKGSLNKENIDFYISMIESYFHKNESTLLTHLNTPSEVAINLDEKSKKVKDFGSIEFFEKKEKYVYQKK